MIYHCMINAKQPIIERNLIQSVLYTSLFIILCYSEIIIIALYRLIGKIKW